MTPAEQGRQAALCRAVGLPLPIPLTERPSYRATRALAPAATLPAGQLAEYRTAFADTLAAVGACRRPGERVHYEHKHRKRTIRVPDDEWAEWTDRARAAGDSVNQWVLDQMRRAVR